MSRLAVAALAGRYVSLEPLAPDHVEAIATAGAGDRSTFGYTQVPDGTDEAAAYVEWLLDDAAHDRAAPFVQRRLDDGVIVGCTRYLNPAWPLGRADPDEVEIGGTWLSPSAQRTPINTEAKVLLLTQAFEIWNVQRVAICTDARQRTESPSDRTTRRTVRRCDAASSPLDSHRRRRPAARHRHLRDHHRRLGRRQDTPRRRRLGTEHSEGLHAAHRSVLTSTPVPLSNSSVKFSQAMIVGLAAGLLGGLFGVGGGLIIVPGLVSLAGMDRRLAHGTSLAATLPIAAASLITYVSHGNVALGGGVLPRDRSHCRRHCRHTLLHVIPKNVLDHDLRHHRARHGDALAISTDSTGRSDLTVGDGVAADRGRAAHRHHRRACWASAAA